jgi:nicotinamide-nucleotide amidase
VKIDVINTGAELMLGRILNTHQQWICRQLTDNGYLVQRQIAIDDSSEAIREAVSDALKRADLIIVTGGLGPTSDDRTRDIIAEMLGRRLQEDKSVLAEILRFFEQRRREPPETVKVQALIPEGATVLANANGTAPGLVLKGAPLEAGTNARMIVMLPGPPRELRPMFLNQALPLIRTSFPPAEPFVCRTLKTTGMGESFLEQKIAGPVAHLLTSGLELGYCARTGEVDLRFVAQGVKAEAIVAEAEKIARAVLGDIIFGSDDDQLENVIIRLLTDRRQTLSLAESCTGGYIANRLTNVAGASAVLLAGLVTYSNEAKQSFLGVTSEALIEHGAVSNPVARQMAEGARQRTGADYALSITGIAGPSGGTDTKPVGTVFIGLASSKGTEVRHHRNSYDRETFKYVSSQQTLEMLRRAILASK